MQCQGSLMKLPRRNFLHLAAGAAALPAMSRIALAQAYPSRQVRIIVGFPAGLGPDITARLIAPLHSERFGQSFIVDNRPGAGSNIGAEIVVRAPADGYTLLLMTAHPSNRGPQPICASFQRDNLRRRFRVRVSYATSQTCRRDVSPYRHYAFHVLQQSRAA